MRRGQIAVAPAASRADREPGTRDKQPQPCKHGNRGQAGLHGAKRHIAQIVAIVVKARRRHICGNQIADRGVLPPKMTFDDRRGCKRD